MSLKQLRASLRRARRRAKHHTLLARRNRNLAKRRRAQINAIGRVSRGPHGAVDWALAQVGTVEKPAASNWGPKISDWIKASGYSGPVPWCQCFANAAAVHGGAPQLRTGYTPTVLAGIGGYKRVSASQVRAGDLVFFKWPGVSSASCDHVGIVVSPPRNGRVETVEGNTSPGNGGSQNNGGGVYHRTDRSTSFVAGYVRPPYPKP